MTARLIPDLDDELTVAAERVEELLLTFAGWEAEDVDQADAEPLVLPAPLADRRALEALRRVWDAVARTQGRRAAEAGVTGRMLGPDGRYEHVPLRLVDVDQADVDALSAAARALGDPRADDDVRDALDQTAGAYGIEPAELVATAARIAGLLDLEPTADSRLLAGLLAGAGPADDLVLDAAGEAAYQRLATRFNAMWALSSPLDRWAY